MLSHVSSLDARRRLLALLAAAIAALAVATGASAEIVTASDAQGRPITFDLRVPGADVEWYASLLRFAAHGDEIRNVTIQIVREQDVGQLCGEAAAACYGRFGGAPRIIVPVGRDARTASTFLHEYGHHLDRSWRVPGVPELNGTPVWWAARGMAQLVAEGRVAFDYSRGWNRSVAEIFAEDYAYAHLRAGYSIPWLAPPDETLRTALLTELGGNPAATPPELAPSGPLVITRTGSLAPRGSRVVPFGLLGPGRRVTLTVTLAGANRTGSRARAEVVCSGRRVASATFGKGRRTRTLDVRSLGPAECEARLVSTSRFAHAYTLRLRLATEGPGAA